MDTTEKSMSIRNPLLTDCQVRVMGDLEVYGGREWWKPDTGMYQLSLRVIWVSWSPCNNNLSLKNTPGGRS